MIGSVHCEVALRRLFSWSAEGPVADWFLLVLPGVIWGASFLFIAEGLESLAASTFLIPVVALILGVVVRGEHVALLSLAGGVVCLAGAWLIRRASLGNR
jgi:drug/metabolite transporter (DMT)-like permease